MEEPLEARGASSLEEMLARLHSRLSNRGAPASTLEFAIATGLLSASLIRSDEIILAVEREALTRSLSRLFGLEDRLAHEVVDLVLSADLPLPDPRELAGYVASAPSTEPGRVVEALLEVAAADGSVHRRELALIRHVAEALELPRSDFQDHLDRYGAVAGVDRVQGLRIPLAESPVTVGRSDDNTVQLPSLSVSRHHARFVPGGDGWTVEDLGSATGTWIDGRRVRSIQLRAATSIRIENFCFRLDPTAGRLTVWDENDLLALSVEDLCVEVKDRRTGRNRRILDGVSFTCYSGELVAITGPSGSGKTTLVNALLGSIATSRGAVRVDDRPCPGLLAHHARRLGLVPQDDIVHAELTVEESLFYSGALRAVAGVSTNELRREVDRVVSELTLESIRSHRIGDPVRRGISGGERKRVNLGQELLNPSTEILILDEPTTGLDPHTGMSIFRLLRSLADRGRLVLVVTHRVDADTLALTDRLLALGTGGFLSYCGPAHEVLDHFEVDTVSKMFDQLRDSDRARRLIDRATREEDGEPPPAPQDANADVNGDGLPLPARMWQLTRQGLRQYGIQTIRYLRTKARDRTAIAINFGQIPLIVLGCWAVLSNSLTVEEPTLDRTLLVVPAALPFVLVISAFWLGCVSSVRELVAEQALWRRERMIGVGSGAYVLSKVTVLAGITALQCILLVLFTEALFGLRDRNLALVQVLTTLFLVGLVGVGLGLCASALFRTPEAAVAMLPVLVIPQLLFGGVLAPFDSMPPLMQSVSRTMVSRWGVQGFVQAGERGIGDNGIATQERCTVLTIPGSESQLCTDSFLSRLGLAPPSGEKASRSRAASSGRSTGALAVLAALACLASLVLTNRRL